MTTTLDLDLAWTATRIGSIDHDGFGSDEFMMVRLDSGEDLTPEVAEELVLARVYTRGRSQPGAYFLHNVYATQAPYSKTKCIVQICHRYDV